MEENFIKIDEWMERYWSAVMLQERDKLSAFFTPEATVRWQCSNEQFTVDEFIQANCEYPGEWDGKIERLERFGSKVITAVRVTNGELSFHVVSFFMMAEGLISSLDEYWGDDGPAPQWRQDLKLGKPIS